MALRTCVSACLCVCTLIRCSVRLLLFFVYFFLISLYTRVFMFMQLMSAYDTAALALARCCLHRLYSLLVIRLCVPKSFGGLNIIFRLDFLFFFSCTVFHCVSVLKRPLSYNIFFHKFFFFPFYLECFKRYCIPMLIYKLTEQVHVFMNI